MSDADAIRICAMYHFVLVEDRLALRNNLSRQLQARGIRGTMLVAHEGINGTIAGTQEAIAAFMQWFRADARFKTLKTSESTAKEMPFHRTKVKLRREIVTLDVPNLPLHQAIHVQPADWNTLITDPEVTLVDTRNEYEIKIGTFTGATNPHTRNFRDFPDYADAHLHPQQHQKIAMFCTGGIRCEKSTAYLKSKGFPLVYHLEGGILKYLEEIPAAESLWQGECFVFDDRVAVNHQLQTGSYTQCHACRMPITAQDKQAPTYIQGISCPHCAGSKSAASRARYQEREKQMQLAEARGEAHIFDNSLPKNR